MSKSLSGPMLTALADATTYLARVWRLELTTGVVYHFTDTNADLVVDGDTYKYDPGIRVSSVEATLDSQGDNASIEVAASAAFLSKLQIRQGAMDGAIFELWYVDHRDPDFYGKIEVFAGSVIDVSFHDKGKAEIQLNSDLSASESNLIGERYSRLCRAKLGDSRCKVDLEALKNDVIVTTVTDAGYSFTSTQLIGLAGYDEYLEFGKVVFITGDNTNFSYEISKFVTATGKVTLANTPRAPIEPGDAVWVYPGCDKQLATCKNRFDNLLNHRAEPYALNQQSYIVQGRIFANDGGRATGNGTYVYKPI